VVVDGARRMINKNVDVTVTSVHQTTAGKMIFGRLEERAEQAAPLLRQAAAAGSGDGGGGTRAGAPGRAENGGRLPERSPHEPQRDPIFPPPEGN
jgi:hypothetical protein